jgi:hypothetical protein
MWTFISSATSARVVSKNGNVDIHIVSNISMVSTVAKEREIIHKVNEIAVNLGGAKNVLVHLTNSIVD